jgi:hypothetical protein
MKRVFEIDEFRCRLVGALGCPFDNMQDHCIVYEESTEDGRCGACKEDDPKIIVEAVVEAVKSA